MIKAKLALVASIATLSIGAWAFSSSPLSAKAEGESSAIEETSIVSSEEESSIESSEEESSEEESSEQSASEIKYVCIINKAYIGYRDSESASYGAGDSKIGDYFLSADGWGELDYSPVIMTIKGNVTTKLESKIVYIYEYKPTLVTFAGKEIHQNSDKTYTLERPTEDGTHDLAIYFTKTLITNPMDLTSINWASLLTVQNLMTILSWVVIVVGILVIYALNRKYKNRGSTTLQEVEKSLHSDIEEQLGAQVADKMTEVFDTTIKTSFEAIIAKLEKVDGNNATLVRCLLLMQENTPESRLAITKCLSELDTSEDQLSEKVKALIESEISKYKSEQEKKQEQIAQAEESVEKWSKTAEEPAEEEGKDEGFGAL